jgi:hypothetical protein
LQALGEISSYFSLNHSVRIFVSTVLQFVNLRATDQAVKQPAPLWGERFAKQFFPVPFSGCFLGSHLMFILLRICCSQSTFFQAFNESQLVAVISLCQAGTIRCCRIN